MILTADQARLGRATVALVGVEHVRGDLAPSLLAGRLPNGPDELALGRVTARDLHLHVGDTLELSHGADGPETPDRHASFRVVGSVVVPTIGGNDGIGQGAVLTAAGFRRLSSQPATTMAAVELRRGAPADAAARIGAQVGADAGSGDRPGAIVNVARVRRVPTLLAVLLAVLLIMTMLHAIVVSIQSRRRDLAVLGALGADRRWIGRAVHWQASVLALLPVVVGIPLGLVAGSVTFRAFVGRIGAVPDPSIPIALVAALTIVLVAAANVVAVVPTRRARRYSTAQRLQTE
jgi:putative ABC transport system permease protein